MNELLSIIVDEFKNLSLEMRRSVLNERRNHDIATALLCLEETEEFAHTISTKLGKIFQDVHVRDEDYESYTIFDSASNDERFALAA